MSDQSYLWWEVMSGYPRLSFLHFNEIYHDPVNLWTSDKSSCEFRAYHVRCVHDWLHLHFSSVKSALIAKHFIWPPMFMMELWFPCQDNNILQRWRQHDRTTPIRPALYHNPLFSGPDSAVIFVLYNLRNTSTPLLRRTITFCCSQSLYFLG